jgi:hypothetical protein
VAWVCERTIPTELTYPVEKWIHKYNVTSDSTHTQSKQVIFLEIINQWIDQDTLISKWLAMGWKIGVWFLAQTEISPFSSSFRYASVLTRPPTSWVLESSFLRIKLPQGYAELRICIALLENITGSAVLCATRLSIKLIKDIHFKKISHITSHYMFQPIWSSTGVGNCCWWEMLHFIFVD